MNKSKIYLDLSKCTEEQQNHISKITNYKIYDVNVGSMMFLMQTEYYTTEWDQCSKDSSIIKERTELTYPEFIKLFEGGEEETSLQIALKALENIINPIGYMKSQLEEGETLNGYAAVMITEKPQFYQDIAKEALEKINSNQ